MLEIDRNGCANVAMKTTTTKMTRSSPRLARRIEKCEQVRPIDEVDEARRIVPFS